MINFDVPRLLQAVLQLIRILNNRSSLNFS